jgi:hypothetical protein
MAEAFVLPQLNIHLALAWAWNAVTDDACHRSTSRSGYRPDRVSSGPSCIAALAVTRQSSSSVREVSFRLNSDIES